MIQHAVMEALRRFLPAYLSSKPRLSREQRRAIWAMEACRTGDLGGHVHGCAQCPEAPRQYSYHSCNHKACPLCGRGATQQWVQQQDARRIAAPHFMVTFTLPEELRGLFFGREAKQAYNMLFDAAATALSGAMERNKQLRASKSGFTMVLHTWNQQMMFHPHVHIIVPGAGLDAAGNYRQVKSAQFLVAAAALKAAYRKRFRELMEQQGWQSDPAVWRKSWAVNVQAFGSGTNAIKYLGAYVGRSVIGDRRIVAISDTHVAFRWKDRAHGGIERVSMIEGIEFVRRYLRHVLPKGLHSVRYCGFHHPAARKTRMKMMLLSGKPVNLGTHDPSSNAATTKPTPHTPTCPCCGAPMILLKRLPPAWKQRRPSARPPPQCPQIPA
jgi:hypothetical protein